MSRPGRADNVIQVNSAEGNRQREERREEATFDPAFEALEQQFELAFAPAPPEPDEEEDCVHGEVDAVGVHVEAAEAA